MSQPEGAIVDHRTRARERLRSQFIRFCVSVGVLIVIQGALEYLIFGEIGPDIQIAETLRSFDPAKLGSLWLEAVGVNGSSTQAADPEDCRENGTLITRCSLVRSDDRRVAPGMFALPMSVWSAVTSQFGREHTPEYRLIALFQILLGALSTVAILAFAMSRPSARQIPIYLIAVVFLIGTIAMSVLLAYPLRWLALQSIPIVSGVYSATGLFSLNKIIDGALHKLVEHVVELV